MAKQARPRLPIGPRTKVSRAEQRHRAVEAIRAAAESALDEHARSVAEIALDKHASAADKKKMLSDALTDMVARFAEMAATDDLTERDRLAVLRSVQLEGAADALAASIMRAEAARDEMARCASAFLWSMQILATSDADRALLAANMKFIDEHSVNVEPWAAPASLLPTERDGQVRLAPPLRSAASRERAYARLQDERIEVGGVPARLTHPVISRAMGESEVAHRVRVSASRRGSRQRRRR